ncbi:MAG: helix-turn-helix domain-containing protein [Chloroflexi bacterium]|nr:helix-turn-helix domain-containing protein [Chloroflexota bacterium]
MEREAKTDAAQPDTHWVGMRRACEILGVNQATLRQWTDSGRVRAFLTPGGHRRYAEHDLLALTGQAAPASDLPALETLLIRSRERYESVIRQCLHANPWFQSFDQQARLHFRILGNSMLNLLTAYVVAPSRRERQRCLEEGREVATQYGQQAADLGLSLTDATEAFLLFRNPVLESVSQWLRAPHAQNVQTGEVLKRMNHFMDQVLVALAAAHEQRQAMAPGQVQVQ